MIFKPSFIFREDGGNPVVITTYQVTKGNTRTHLQSLELFLQQFSFSQSIVTKQSINGDTSSSEGLEAYWMEQHPKYDGVAYDVAIIGLKSTFTM